MYKMASLAGLVIDYYDDPNFWKIDEVKYLVKQGVLLSEDRLADLGDHQFAVKIAGATNFKRAFPLYNKTAITLSHDYLQKSADFLPHEAVMEAYANIKKAGDSFGLTLKPIEYTQSVCLTGGSEILAAFETNLMSSLERMPIAERLTVCNDFAKQASASDYEIRNTRILDYVIKDTVGDLDVLREGLSQRESLVKAANSDLAEHVWGAVIEKMASDTTPGKLVALLSTFDKWASFGQYYDAVLFDPVRTVYGVTKTASANVFRDSSVGAAMPPKQTLTHFEILDAAGAIPSSDDSNINRVFQTCLQNPVHYYYNGPAAFKKEINKQIGLSRRKTEK